VILLIGASVAILLATGIRVVLERLPDFPRARSILAKAFDCVWARRRGTSK